MKKCCMFKYNWRSFFFLKTNHFCLLDEQFKLGFWVRLITVCTCSLEKYLASITLAWMTQKSVYLFQIPTVYPIYPIYEGSFVTKGCHSKKRVTASLLLLFVLLVRKQFGKIKSVSFVRSACLFKTCLLLWSH